MTSDFLFSTRIRNGDNRAGDQFVEKYYSFIYQYCFLHIHDQERAEDMAQETFVRFFGASDERNRNRKGEELSIQNRKGNIIKNDYKKKKEILSD